MKHFQWREWLRTILCVGGGNSAISGVTLIFDEGIHVICNPDMATVRRGESSEETESTTTASRRGSEDSDSGVNLSEKEVTHQHPGRGPEGFFRESWSTSQLC